MFSQNSFPFPEGGLRVSIFTSARGLEKPRKTSSFLPPTGLRVSGLRRAQETNRGGRWCGRLLPRGGAGDEGAGRSFHEFTWPEGQTSDLSFATAAKQQEYELRQPEPWQEAFRKFLPVFDRVLVERSAAETVTKGGIMLPEKSQGKELQATVVAVRSGSKGKGGEIQPVSVKVGDKVLPEYGGTKVVLDDKDSFLFRDGDILGKYVD